MILRIERYKNTRHWALYDGAELVVVTVYRRGAQEVQRRLAAQAPAATEAAARSRRGGGCGAAGPGAGRARPGTGAAGPGRRPGGAGTRPAKRLGGSRRRVATAARPAGWAATRGSATGAGPAP